MSVSTHMDDLKLYGKNPDDLIKKPIKHGLMVS